MGAERDILHWQGGGLQQINDRQLVYDPLNFLLLLSHGELGWHLAVQKHDTIKTMQFNVVSLLHTDCTSRPLGTHCCIVLQDYFCARFPLLTTECMCLACLGYWPPADYKGDIQSVDVNWDPYSIW